MMVLRSEISEFTRAGYCNHVNHEIGIFVLKYTNMKTCKKCLISKPTNDFTKNSQKKDGLSVLCKDCYNKRQRDYRRSNDSICTKKYEKTLSGFIMRMYRNMLSRVSGVQVQKSHLYEGKYILPKLEFYKWVLSNDTFKDLFEKYKESGYNRKLAPTIDRIDSSIGYQIDNMQVLTHSENSRKGAMSKRRF